MYILLKFKFNLKCIILNINLNIVCDDHRIVTIANYIHYIQSAVHAMNTVLFRSDLW